MAVPQVQASGSFASDLEINSPLPTVVTLSETSSVASPSQSRCQSVDVPVAQRVLVNGGRLRGPSRRSGFSPTPQAATPPTTQAPPSPLRQELPRRATIGQISPIVSPIAVIPPEEQVSAVVNLSSARRENGEVTPQLFFRSMPEATTAGSPVKEVVTPPAGVGQKTFAKDLFSIPALCQQLPAVAAEPTVTTFIRNVTSLPTAPVTIPELKLRAPESGVKVHEVDALLLAERNRIFLAVQDIMANHLRIHTDSMNQELNKVMNMVKALSGSCDERLVRMDLDLASRASVLQGVKRDLEGHHSQIKDLLHSKASTPSGYLVNEQREEIISMIEGVSKEMRNQYRNLMSGLSAQKDVHERQDQAIAELRRELRNEQNVSLERQSEYRDDLQATQVRAEKAIADLRMQVSQSLQVVRGDLLTEIESFRGYGNLSDRLSNLEGRHEEVHQALLDMNIGELTRLVRNEGSARLELQRELEALRAANLGTAHELRSELDAVRESLQRARAAPTEDRNLREKVIHMERGLTEVRAMANSLKSSHVSSREPMLTKDIQELSRQISEESNARVDLSQCLDAYRGAYLNTTTELRAELDVALERLARMEFRSAEASRR